MPATGSREERLTPPPRRGKPEQREEFQRDRDRVLYTDALRRLAGVTQVAGAAEGHLFHNRLTHTIKVAQIARRLAERISAGVKSQAQKRRVVFWGGLDCDVVEAAALIHDLGHPPFGHIAETELDALASEHGLADGFEGNAQSFRIVTRLAVHRDPGREDGYEGLNLTRAVLNASLKYPWLRSRDKGRKEHKKFGAYGDDRVAFLFARAGQVAGRKSLEASIMDFADDVAYSVHDLEDFFRAGLIPITTLTRDKDAFRRFLAAWCIDPRTPFDRQDIEAQETALRLMLADLFPFDDGYRDTFEHRASLRTATSSLIQRCVWSAAISDEDESSALTIPIEIRVQLKLLQRLVWVNVITNPRLATQQHGQRRIIRTLFESYLGAVKERDYALVPPLFHRALASLPARRRKVTVKSRPSPAETRLAIDIVASFSDSQAVMLYRRLAGVTPGSVTDYFA